MKQSRYTRLKANGDPPGGRVLPSYNTPRTEAPYQYRTAIADEMRAYMDEEKYKKVKQLIEEGKLKRSFGTKTSVALPEKPYNPADKVTRSPVPSVKETNDFGILSGGSKGNTGKGISDILPYASNIVNSFRRPPMPSRRARVPLVTAPRINLDNRRRELEGQIRGLDKNADMMLDENTSAAVKRSNLAAKLREGSSISEAEANANAQMSQTTAGQNTYINMYNSGKDDEYNDLLTNRKLAMTRFSQQNLADVSDKFMRQTEQSDAATLDLKKGAYLAKLFEKSGVLGRIDPDAEKMLKGYMKINKYGGKLKMFPEGGKLPNKRQKLEEWNNFVSFMDERKIDKEALNKKDQTMGKTLLTEWLKINPKASLRYEDVPFIQEQFKNYRNYSIAQHKAGKIKLTGDPGANYENYMPELSAVDGWLGSQTYRRFPNEYLITLDNGQVVAKVDKGVAVPSQKQYGGILKRRKIS